MNRRSLLFALLALGLGLVFYATFFISSDEDKIQRACDQLEMALRLPPDRGNPALFAIHFKAGLGELLVEGGQFVVPEAGEGPQGLQAVMAGMMRYGERYSSAEVHLENRRIENLTANQATVRARAVASAVESGAQGPRRHERDVVLSLEKQDGHWKFSRIEATRPPG